MTRRGQDGQQPLLGVGAPGIRLICGDSLAVLPTLAADSVDAIVTDPPYGLSAAGPAEVAACLAAWGAGAPYQVQQGKSGFMNKAWDAWVPGPELWREVLRVLKPGGHALIFAGARTQDIMGISLRLAGFELLDTLMFLFGSGFPKGLAVDKAIEREGFGAEAAAALAGWNTQLKPAYEPIILCRKPLAERTVARNVLAHGVGALHVDACRVGTSKEVPASMPKDRRGHGILGEFKTHDGGVGQDPDVGRYPANVLHDGGAEVEAAFAAYGARGASAPVAGTEASAASTGRVTGARARVPGVFHADTGSASRFFYAAKASGEDREFANDHPTLKPLALMRWCVRLITPPKGVVLDCFMGSGSTGRACAAEGVAFIGIEREAAYAAIAQRRLLVKDLEVIG
jgi:DNA modification methylase